MRLEHGDIERAPGGGGDDLRRRHAGAALMHIGAEPGHQRAEVAARKKDRDGKGGDGPDTIFGGVGMAESTGTQADLCVGEGGNDTIATTADECEFWID